MNNERLTADLLDFNEIYKQAAAETGAAYVDTWEAFADDRGRFSSYGPDINGQVVRLRAGDGVHFTRAGSRKLAYFVEGDIRRTLEKTKPSLDPETITVTAPGNVPASLDVPAPDLPALGPVGPEGPGGGVSGPRSFRRTCERMIRVSSRSASRCAARMSAVTTQLIRVRPHDIPHECACCAIFTRDGLGQRRLRPNDLDRSAAPRRWRVAGCACGGVLQVLSNAGALGVG
jgi:hypothetical protein